MSAPLIPINVAETVIEPFWDPARSGLGQWTIAGGRRHGLKVDQFWCYVRFEWARRPAGTPALSLSRTFRIDCSRYDRLLASIMAPADTRVVLTAATDRGQRSASAVSDGTVKREFALDLKGARRLERLTIDLYATREGAQNGWLNWVGLQNSALLARHLDQWKDVDARWDGYLMPETHRVDSPPRVGLLATAKEMAVLRRLHAAHVRKHGTSPFIETAAQAAAIEPETRVGPNIKCFAERWFCRDRENDKNLLGLDLIGYAGQAAVAGALLGDRRLLRLGARYALTIAWCDHWDDFVCFTPGGTFDQRCFTASTCALQCALVLDLAWECFTPLGREFIMQRIAKAGLADITFNTWRYDYIFDCNQLAWFSPGRMAGALMLERSWPRVRTEVEQARRDLVESLNRIVLWDGSFVEGPSYFTTVGRHAGLALHMYARARGKRAADVMPRCLLKTASFAAAIVSTDENRDVIPFCDSRSVLDPETFAIMAAMLPASQWTALLRKSMARSRGMPASLPALALSLRVPRRSPPPPPFVRLREMGVVASTRRLGKEWVKLFIMGNKANAGHSHEDKGSFVLEYAGDTFAADPGTVDYSSPFAAALKHCQFHNMLVPFGLTDRPCPANPIPCDVKMVGRGDARAFSGTIDATPGWEPYYRRWIRRWSSPRPDRLVIRDEYELRRGRGVEFLWQTWLPVVVDGNTVRVKGRRGVVTLTAPDTCDVSVAAESVPGDGLAAAESAPRQLNRVSIRRTGRSGVLNVDIRLSNGG